MKLESRSPQGVKPINRESVLRSLLTAPLEGISTFTRLHERLETDLRFRYQCGFRLDERALSVSILSRVFATITEKGISKSLFIDLVNQFRDSCIFNGEHLAIDSSAICAHEKKQPKSHSQETGNANWGTKYDTFENKSTWFGYKIHLAVDTKSELPVSLQVTPAHTYDVEMAILLMQDIAENLGWKFKFVMMDAGYGQLKNYETASGYGVQAIVALNRRGGKEPPAGLTSNGTPRCSMGFEMAYWGADGDRLKFRCPHVLGNVNCPLGAAACSDSNYGMVLKVNIKDDLRRYSNPHRNSQKWTELYNERTSVERCNSRLKENLTVNNLHVGGVCKVTTHVYFNAIVLLASAITFSIASKSDKVA